MQHLWLIRHAESIANAGYVTNDPHSIGLSPLGGIQAKKLADQFPLKPELIVTTKYDRTGLTAAPLLNRFPDVPTAVWPIHEFTYLAPARYSGQTYEQRRPAAEAYWDRNDPDHLDGEGAESFREFVARVRTILEHARAAEQEFLAVFCHGFVIKTFIWELLSGGGEVTVNYMRGYNDFQKTFPVKNGSVTPIQIDGDAPPEVGQALLYPYDKAWPKWTAPHPPKPTSKGFISRFAEGIGRQILVRGSTD